MVVARSDAQTSPLPNFPIPSWSKIRAHAAQFNGTWIQQAAIARGEGNAAHWPAGCNLLYFSMTTVNVAFFQHHA
jgi:hypothetical protein